MLRPLNAAPWRALRNALAPVVWLVAALAVAVQAHALDITARTVPEIDGPGSTRQRLVLSGKIEHGDAIKVAHALATAPLAQFDGVVLHSPGGATFEGRHIGELLDRMVVRVIVRPPFRCVSACFFIYVGAPMRSAQGWPQAATMAVHRGFVPADRADLISTEALERLEAYEQGNFARWLEAQGTPEHLVAAIVAGKVLPFVRLTQRDIDLTGPRSPRYDAWIEASCAGSGKLAAWRVREVPPPVGQDELAEAKERGECESRRIEAERRYQQFALQTELELHEQREARRAAAFPSKSP